MKTKIFCVLLVLMSLTSCNLKKDNNNEKIATQQEMRAVWISYYEYDFLNEDLENIKNKIDLMFENISALNLNTVFVHVRGNADAIYDSKYFTHYKNLENLRREHPDFDLFEYMIESANDNNLKIHAWINPFRVSNSSGDINTLPDGHIAKKWYNEGNIDNKIVSYDNKLFFNPASLEVRELILNGVREIVDNYKVDGIHFDDYFYPTTDKAFDAQNYTAYCQKTAYPLNLKDWRTTNISALISAVKQITQKNNIIFGVSPSAYVDGDYLQSNGYADIKKWMSSDCFVDYIIPQIYWGFEYPDENFCFDTLVNKWNGIRKNNSVKLYVGLAAYKSGTYDQNNEWIENSDILKRQILYLRNSKINGFSLFSYSYVFSDNIACVKEKNNMATILNKNSGY